MLERSHGKVRSTRKRASDLRPAGTVGEPSGTRSAGGRFAAGNAVGRNRGVKAVIRRHLGREASTPVVEQLTRDVRVTCAALKADLPSDAPSVLLLVQARATWSVLQQHLTTLALDAGLTTDAGRGYLELAIKLDQRAERLAITSLDVATTLAEAERRKPTGGFPWLTSDEPPTSPAGASHAGDDSEPVDTDQSASAGHADSEDNEP